MAANKINQDSLRRTIDKLSWKSTIPAAKNHELNEYETDIYNVAWKRGAGGMVPALLRAVNALEEIVRGDFTQPDKIAREALADLEEILQIDGASK